MLALKRFQEWREVGVRLFVAVEVPGDVQEKLGAGWGRSPPGGPIRRMNAGYESRCGSSTPTSSGAGPSCAPSSTEWRRRRRPSASTGKGASSRPTPLWPGCARSSARGTRRRFWIGSRESSSASGAATGPFSSKASWPPAALATRGWGSFPSRYKRSGRPGPLFRPSPRPSPQRGEGEGRPLRGFSR